MSRIVFMFDLEEGHLLPTFPFANSLKRAGHEIAYIAFKDSEDVIRRAGFEYYPFCPTYYPKGFKDRYKDLVVNNDHRGFDMHLEAFVDGSFDTLLANINPDIIIVSSFFTIEALFLYYKHNIIPIVLSSIMYEVDDPLCDICAAEIMTLPADQSMHLLDLVSGKKLKYSSFKELVAPLASFTHLILCSKDFEMSTVHHNSKTVYIGSGGQKENVPHDSSIPFTNGRKIIYASMGSQAYIYRDKLNALYSKLVEVMKREEFGDYHLIFSSGGNEFQPGVNASGNVTIVKWINQQLVLREAALAFIHGGLGSVKECISAEVPMIVVPGSRDQPANAMRVEQYHLGSVVDILSVSIDDLASIIRRVLGDQELKTNLKEMKTKFTNLDRREIGVSIVEQAIAGKILSPSE